jgi:hypothetical protein
MIYLKKFNESQGDFKEQLRDFCETHLAYLLDNGFIVEINEFEDLDGFELLIKQGEVTAPGGYERQPLFTWEDVKDHIGPFVFYLDKEYELYKSPEKIGKSEPGDIGIVQSELDSLFEPFNVEEISDENYEPFLDQKSGFTPSSSRRSSAKLEYVLIYSVLKNK